MCPREMPSAPLMHAARPMPKNIVPKIQQNMTAPTTPFLRGFGFTVDNFQNFLALSDCGALTLYLFSMRVTDPTLFPIREKVLAGETLSYDDGGALYRSR